jgi:uncharacterized membrane protein YgcG
MFREHVATGAVISTGVCVAAYSYALVTDPILLLFLFGVTVVGSFLPDVDSDSGMPFYLVFGTASLAATGIVALYTLASPYAADWRYLLGIPAAALFFFWFVVGAVVKKCTKHRGIFHSLPALAIAGTATFLLARHYGLDDMTALVFAGAMGLGFLSHLVLDELYSEITLDGIPFNTKQSAGTAMKWFSRQRGVNVATYVILATLLYTAWQPQKAFAFYNDSDIIELENDAPPAPPDDGPTTGDSSGTGSGAGQGGVVDDGDEGTQSQGSSNSGDGQSGGTSGGGGGGGASGGSSSSQTDEDLVDSLVSAGIITGSGAVSGSSLFEDSIVGGGAGSVTIDGEGVRNYFRGKYDLQELLLGWRAGTDARLSARGLGYIAASTALRDRNVDGVSFTADRFDIRYRSRGYLLAIIPITFPVRVSVVPEAAAGRVTVQLPWYRFFVREFFTARGLADDIDAVIGAEVGKNTATDADLKAALFLAVADYLRTKVGTVAGTVGE